jgi:hypothetical protein
MSKYFLILGIPSIVLLFLPYTSNVSPWQAVSSSDGWHWDNPIALLGVPFFLSIPILVAQTRMLLRKTFPKGERVTYRLLAYAALTAGAALLGSGFWTEGYSRDLVHMGFEWGIPCAAALWVMILSAKKLNPEEAATTALQAAWLPNAILCAITFWEKDFFLSGWEIGAYLAAFTIGLYVVQITLSMRKVGRIRSF